MRDAVRLPRFRANSCIRGGDVSRSRCCLPNAQEAPALAGREDGDVEAATHRLPEHGALVVVKLGPDRAVAVRDDLFDAGFLAARRGGEDIVEALALGCACGSAAQPTWEEA
jgi:sugar/nucleoside kinase (ribokinase family)